MATKTGYKPNQAPSPSRGNNYPNDPVGVDDDSNDDSFYVIVIVILLCVILFFMPVLMWMYMDIRQTEIKVQKLVKKLEEK
jgi:nitric oxide reductase large subunit